MNDERTGNDDRDDPLEPSSSNRDRSTEGSPPPEEAAERLLRAEADPFLAAGTANVISSNLEVTFKEHPVLTWADHGDPGGSR